jgi:ribosomal protein S18 acetylase RimI-like enzyme
VTPDAWRERWADEAARYGQAPLPETFDDPPNAGFRFEPAQAAAQELSAATADLVASVVIPALVRAAVRRGWWDPLAVRAATDAAQVPTGVPTVHARVDADGFGRLRLADRVAPIGSESDVRAILGGALAHPSDRVSITGAVVQDVIVGLVVSAAAESGVGREILALGVAPEHRGHGLASAMLEAHVNSFRPGDESLSANITVAERDPFGPLDHALRASIARRLLEGAGFEVRPASGRVRGVDPLAIEATRG